MKRFRDGSIFDSKIFSIITSRILNIPRDHDVKNFVYYFTQKHKRPCFFKLQIKCNRG